MKLRHVPFLVWLTGLAAFAAANANFEVFGFSASGYAWVLPLVVALLVLARHPNRVKFPWPIWVPWALLLVVYLVEADDAHALQRTAMMLCPVVVGMAASCSRLTPVTPRETRRFLRVLAIAVGLGIVWHAGLLISGTLPVYGGSATSVMTASLLAAMFATGYSFGRRTDLGWWVAIQLVPWIALTRTGIVASAVTLPFCFGPLKVRTRLISLGAIALGSVALFSTPRMQARMFYSGSGTLSEISLQNRNFATSGRSALWPELLEEIKSKPWVGHGANASETFISATRPDLAHPHNDWLRLLFDYGILGTGFFVITFIAQGLHALAAARRAPDFARLLFLSCALSFVVLFVFMCTDNIILYAAFFGNLLFALLGLAYGSVGRRKNGRALAGSFETHGLPERSARTNDKRRGEPGTADAYPWTLPRPGGTS